MLFEKKLFTRRNLCYHGFGGMLMMKRLTLLLTCLLLPVAALADPLPFYPYTFSGKVAATYDTPTLKYSVESFYYQNASCYVAKIWMADPGRQIRKGTANWEVDLELPSVMAEDVPGAALVVNGSGYVSPIFPWIPEDYPGVSEDYHYTPLGSLTITNGQIFRNLPGVLFYGLTLQEDGLHMHIAEENEEVLAQHPTQTWSFYIECPVIVNHQSILDPDWRFTKSPAIRTMVAKMDDNNYITLTVTGRPVGLTMAQCVKLLQTKFDPEWAYNLDGGPSSALLVRGVGETELTALHGNKTQDTDVMAFIELETDE